MNANELADELDNMLKAIGLTDNRVPTMLRQQQAEIEELKTKMSLNSYDDAKNVANQLLQSDNEPVAWIINGRLSDEFYTTSELDKIIPLYIHPADLTDEEIDDFTVRIYNCRTGAEAHEIVLAILRKTQEK